jgi:hypothetical protein
VFGARPGNSNNIYFLKGIVADQGAGYLPGQDDQRNRVHMGGGNTGNPICCPRSGGQESDTNLTGDSGKAICGMHSPLFMTNQDIGNIGIHQGIEKVENGTSRISEYCFHTLFLKTPDDCLGSSNFSHESIPL